MKTTIGPLPYTHYTHLLFLLVVSAHVGVADVGPLLGTHHLDGAVGLGGQHVDQRVRVLVQRHTRRRLQRLPVDSVGLHGLN